MIVKNVVLHGGFLCGCRKVALRRTNAASFQCRLGHERATIALALLFALLATACSDDPSKGRQTSQSTVASQSTNTPQPAGLDKLQHIVVIYMENHRFLNLYGEFEGANGLSKAGDHATQIDRDGHPYKELPRPPGNAFPANLPNAPFNIEKYVPINAKTPDLIHRFYQQQGQIDDGRMDRFAALSDAKGLVMGYYH